MGLDENGDLRAESFALGSIFVSARFQQLVWQCCMNLAGRACKYDARSIVPKVLPNTKEILTILFHFSSSESFTIHNPPKKLIAGPEGFVYT